jgi:two-component system chemotaxis sensor kinase CheA
MISTVQGRAEMALVRNSLLPIVRLHKLFNLSPRSTNPCECLLIVAENGAKRFCLMVDDLLGKQEVVIKSLGEKFQHVAGVAGGAILGDGRVGLILDLERLFGGGGGE